MLSTKKHMQIPELHLFWNTQIKKVTVHLVAYPQQCLCQWVDKGTLGLIYVCHSQNQSRKLIVIGITSLKVNKICASIII